MTAWHDLLKTDCKDTAAMKTIKELLEQQGYTAAVDFPASACWEALSKAYPDAKIIHTQRRSADVSFESSSNTILTFNQVFPFNIVTKVSPFFRQHSKMVDKLWTKVLGTPVSASDPNFVSGHKKDFIDSYNANNARVESVLSTSDRLLVHDHKNGWTPLSKFLNKPVPQEPFPHTNKRAEFKQFVRAIGIGFCVVVIAALAVVVYAIQLVLKFARGGKVKGV